MRYGRCLQSISLHDLLTTVGESDIAPFKCENDFGGKRGAGSSVFDVQSFSPRVIHSSIPDERTHRLGKGWMKKLQGENGMLCPPRESSRVSEAIAVYEDTTGIRLAAEHGAEIFLGSEALEALLLRPGHESTRWTIPLLCTDVESRPLVVLEDPLPVRSTTREWLAKGFTAGLVETAIASARSVEEQGKKFHETRPSDVPLQYVYTLLTFPIAYTEGRRQRPLVALIRTTNTIRDENGLPLRLRLSLEYFPERGRELSTPHESVTWIMERMLQPECRVVLARVNPYKAEISGFEERGVAHATATSDPLPHFKGAAIVLNALGRIGQDVGRAGRRIGRWNILCLPGRDVSSSSGPQALISVHGEEQTQEGGGSANVERESIDIKCELAAANEVMTSRLSLMACFRLWECDGDRLPFTFPEKPKV